jgi:hypothetical protein
MKKYKEHKMNIVIKKCIKKCQLNDINTQVIDTNFFEVRNKQKNDIDILKTIIFPPHIGIQNNILCLQQYNNFMKNISFQFNYCCVCNEKTFMKNLTICGILDLIQN